MNGADTDRVLLVDDDRQLLGTMTRTLGRRFNLVTAAGGTQALELLMDRGPFAVLVSDLQMPGLDGIAVLEAARGVAPDTVRILLTGTADRERLIDAINTGYLFRFLEKPVSDEALAEAFTAGLQQYRRVWAERELTAARQRHRLLIGVVHGFIRLMEARDPYTAGHQERTAALATAIAREMGLPPRQVEVIATAGMIHDLGKMYVPAEFLNRPGKLSALEMQVVREHPRVGYGVLREVDFELPVAEFVLQHHERLNGQGYPRGLKGGEIHLEARILAVADVVEAMSSHRPYRPALGLSRAWEELARGKGELYDPEVVNACERVLEAKLWEPGPLRTTDFCWFHEPDRLF
ncbi:MAG: HD domain-containing protein [Deltaproteobacteria bacterium]|nr:HD domain-containing protein [Deltaproteobacteria bacterium]